jgi:hypothetical protein
LNQQHHQEFIPLLSYFTQKMIVPYTTITQKATNALFSSQNDDTDDVEDTATVSSCLDLLFVLLIYVLAAY